MIVLGIISLWILAGPTSAQSTSPLIFRDTIGTTLSYPSDQYRDPAIMECTTPISETEYFGQEIKISFSASGMGGATSNSLFVNYSVDQGAGYCMPPLPDRSSGHDRSGYIVRLIRHGDGTNEIKFYRSDEGWAKEIKNDWTLPFNPTTTLRRIRIRHDKIGEHLIRAEFDTGIAIERTWVFHDDFYPPDNEHRGFGLAAKGHASVNSTLRVSVDEIEVVGIITRPSPPAADNNKSTAGLEFTRILEKDPDNSAALKKMAHIEMTAGNLGFANRFLKRLLKIQKEQLGSDHPDVANTLIEQAGLYLSKDPYESEQLYKEALRIRRKAYGSLHPLVAEAINHLAGIYKNQKRFTEAERHFARALEIMEGSRGGHDPGLVPILSDLADIYETRGEFSLQEPILRRIISLMEKSPASDSLLLAKHIQSLAFACSKLGRTDELVPLLERVLDSKERALGNDHPDIAKAMTNLATVYQNNGKLVDAERLYKRALEIRRKNLGPDHPFTVNELHNLGVLYMKQGKYVEAEEALKQALAIIDRSLGPTHANAAMILEKLSKLYRTTGRATESERVSRRPREIQGLEMGPRKP